MADERNFGPIAVRVCLKCRANACPDRDGRWVCPECGWTAAQLVEYVPKSTREAAEAEAERLREALNEIAHTYGLDQGPGDGNHLREIARAALSPREDSEQ